MAWSAAPEQDKGSPDRTGFLGDSSPTPSSCPALRPRGCHITGLQRANCAVLAARTLLPAALTRAGLWAENPQQPTSTALLGTGRKTPSGKRWSHFWKLSVGPIDHGPLVLLRKPFPQMSGMSEDKLMKI